MEANNGPVDFERSWSVIKLRYSNHDAQDPSTLSRPSSPSPCVLLTITIPNISISIHYLIILLPFTYYLLLPYP